MNLLPMDEGTKRRVRDLAERSAKPENWYYTATNPPKGSPVGNPEREAMVGTFRVVFTWSVGADGNVFRHATMTSTHSRHGLPTREAAFTIAMWLGFTGVQEDEHGLVHDPAPDWFVGLSQIDRCLVLGQQIVED